MEQYMAEYKSLYKLKDGKLSFILPSKEASFCQDAIGYLSGYFVTLEKLFERQTAPYTTRRYTWCVLIVVTWLRRMKNGFVRTICVELTGVGVRTGVTR